MSKSFKKWLIFKNHVVSCEGILSRVRVLSKWVKGWKLLKLEYLLVYEIRPFSWWFEGKGVGVLEGRN